MVLVSHCGQVRSEDAAILYRKSHACAWCRIRRERVRGGREVGSRGIMLRRLWCTARPRQQCLAAVVRGGRAAGHCFAGRPYRERSLPAVRGDTRSGNTIAHHAAWSCTRYGMYVPRDGAERIAGAVSRRFRGAASWPVAGQQMERGSTGHGA
jgi:hypothetical protein